MTLTDGIFVGSGADAGETIIRNWDKLSDPTGQIVPDYGFAQSEREIASAGASKSAAA